MVTYNKESRLSKSIVAVVLAVLIIVVTIIRAAGGLRGGRLAFEAPAAPSQAEGLLEGGSEGEEGERRGEVGGRK